MDGGLRRDAEFPLTRAEALDRLREFLPRAGADYARLRNLDHGPGQHDHVSRLSAALRRRLLSETEVVAAVIARHGLRGAEKFLSEVLWRSYWKGWLEQRPAVWQGYRQALARAEAECAADPGLARRHQAALDGRTGIDCFDHWMGELAETGYLHNWARMQFASIWVFTLGLGWERGAALTLRLLRDADPASNTLSWRWVAGLHTAGKAYLADAARIHAMTGGRFSPDGLARHAVIPEDSIAVPPVTAPRPHRRPDPAEPALLLVTPEDLSLETESAVARLDIRAIAALPPTTAPDRRAMADALDRAGAHWGLSPAECADLPDIVDLARRSGARQIVTGYLPVGPEADRLFPLRAAAEAGGIALAEHQRDWDARVWPHCRQGFFALKEQMPRLLAGLGAADA